ncbi:hypothetical protein A2574_01295 [Candidatus Shapirobacteria bacterium RIFOXYD1_FULL_38_32]|uniref:Uncharacterized protein n=2 Tax=Candidatus Shapironibacteriota TaxID=1752721 RepID=A0A0G0MZ38_9BACT|nr:MAG: hypothetical protein US90_C0008G0018 [Candidatus Shapirobacteria bacterium GW2011_GWE2_38_30]KKQ91182.1 MAG: hypothetical protein UT14_C0020G0004 [Candidatus Shapirobacteria bacterium GW2011_GWE1_38_92]OGL56905.1 MAG: hypothetical protein A2410_01655 [Candidatus Shapirobacteria bacterium RIFOXYC1_FULL_38_24]OGL57474.1 MAG: hypothetical protein A2574_01295 [Candidatus Shapirobacteria bacterium RIFOXYD1_FULL_38_32]HAP37357.1 hypothetical protein [Candidatus Shapirobacteria bacterium]
MGKLVKIEGGKLVGVNSDGTVIFEVKKSLDELKLAQLPKRRVREKPAEKKPWPRWKDGSFLTRQQATDENYQIETDIA